MVSLSLFLFGWFVGGSGPQRVLSVDIFEQGTKHTWVLPFSLERSQQGFREPMVRAPLVGELTYRQERVRSETATNQDGRSSFVFSFLDPPKPEEPVRLRVRAEDESILLDRWIAHPPLGEPKPEVRAPLPARFTGDRAFAFDLFAEPTFQTVKPTLVWIKRVPEGSLQKEPIRVTSIEGDEVSIANDSMRVCGPDLLEIPVTPIGLHPVLRVRATLGDQQVSLEAALPLDASAPYLETDELRPDTWGSVRVIQPNERDHTQLFLYNDRGLVFSENVFLMKRDGFFVDEHPMVPLAPGPHWLLVSPDAPGRNGPSSAAKRIVVGRNSKRDACAFESNAWQKPAFAGPLRVESNAEDLEKNVRSKRTLGRIIASIGLLLGVLGEGWLLQRSGTKRAETGGMLRERWIAIAITCLGFLLLALLLWRG